jgi:hypothetical protein
LEEEETQRKKAAEVLEVKRMPRKPYPKKPNGLKKNRKTEVVAHQSTRVGRRGQAKEISEKKAGRSKQTKN